MRLLSTVLLASTIVAAAPVLADEVAPPAELTLPKAAALAVQDHIQVATKTTITRGSGKTVTRAVRTESYDVEVTSIDTKTKRKITGAHITYGKLATTGTWPAGVLGVLVNNENISEFQLDLTAEAGRRITFDAVDGVWGDPHVDALAALEARHGWLAQGVPLRASLAGKHFTAGTAVNLGGQDIEIVSGAVAASITDAAITFQKLDAGVATFGLAATMAGKVAITGTVLVDAATGRVSSLRIEASNMSEMGETESLSEMGEEQQLRLVQVQTFTYQTPRASSVDG